MNNIPEHRKKVGGLWDEMGQLQFEFLKNNGLQPNHKFLDIACGSFRLGRFAINYLEVGNYFGIDADLKTLEDGKTFEIAHLLLSKKPNILHNQEFQFYKFDTKFDFMIAQSLWTHLNLNIILKCIINIKEVLSENGKCFVTFFENDNILNLSKIAQTNKLFTNLDSDPYHYTFNTLKNLINEVGLEVEYIGDWNHPRNQKIILLRHKKGSVI
jgi:SAM-dependent methyltransferase